MKFYVNVEDEIKTYYSESILFFVYLATKLNQYMKPWTIYVTAPKPRHPQRKWHEYQFDDLK